jgi:hypothetical protein
MDIQLLSMVAGLRGKIMNSRVLVVALSMLFLVISDLTGQIVRCVNPLSVGRTDVLVSIPLRSFNVKPVAFRDGATVVPHQIVDGQILLLLSLGPEEKKNLTVDVAGQVPVFPKRTQADLAVKVDYVLTSGTYVGGRFEKVLTARTPVGNKSHNAYFKYEGPGWESDLVAYRLYLDERNRCDIFGKKVKGVVLDRVGVNDLVSDGKESYQHPLEWGQDIFKVGTSLGMGSFALWQDGRPVFAEVIDSARCRVMEDGPIFSALSVDYYGWKVAGKSRNLKARLSIAAGSRLTHVVLTARGAQADFCTGLAKHDGCVLMTSPNSVRSRWRYVAFYGKQALSGDNLGIAIFYQMSDCVRTTEDSLSQIVVLRPDKGKVQYYFAAAWEQEPGGIKDAAEFSKFLESTVQSLGAPVLATVKKARENLWNPRAGE